MDSKQPTISLEQAANSIEQGISDLVIRALKSELANARVRIAVLEAAAAAAAPGADKLPE